jgi:sugar phosphate isomerase/epimerase
MFERLHVRVPFRELEQALPFLLQERLQPEIAFRGTDLDLVRDTNLADYGKSFARAGLQVTVHAPFYDLNPGALEPLVQDATRLRFKQALRAAATLGGRLVVFHPGYDRWTYGGQDHLWLEQSLNFWPPLLEKAKNLGLLVALENIFEPDPRLLGTLLDTLGAPHFGHCFDIGHWRLFAESPLPDWFAALGHRLLHLHLHDNFGFADEHLPVGLGDIDFSALFSLVQGLGTRPSMTLEANDQQALLRSLAGVAPFLIRI